LEEVEDDVKGRFRPATGAMAVVDGVVPMDRVGSAAMRMM